jgi:hypothetical protein
MSGGTSDDVSDELSDEPVEGIRGGSARPI